MMIKGGHHITVSSHNTSHQTNQGQHHKQQSKECYQNPTQNHKTKAKHKSKANQDHYRLQDQAKHAYNTSHVSQPCDQTTTHQKKKKKKGKPTFKTNQLINMLKKKNKINQVIINASKKKPML